MAENINNSTASGRHVIPDIFVEIDFSYLDDFTQSSDNADNNISSSDKDKSSADLSVVESSVVYPEQKNETPVVYTPNAVMSDNIVPAEEIVFSAPVYHESQPYFPRKAFWLTTVAAAALILATTVIPSMKKHANSVTKTKTKTEKTVKSAAVTDEMRTYRDELLNKSGMNIFEMLPSDKAILDFNNVVSEVAGKDAVSVNTAKYDFNENFSDKKHNLIFTSLGNDEGGKAGYAESPYDRNGGHAFGKYQSMPETMVGYGYLARSDENPDLKSIRKWKDQSFDSEYMTIVYDGKVNHYKWTGQDGMKSLNDWCNTDKGHELQEKFGRSHYADNVATIRKNGRSLYNTLHIVDVPLYDKKNKVKGHETKIILVDEAGLAYAAHLMGAGGILTVARNGFRPSSGLSGDINRNIANAIRYLERGSNVDQKIRKTGKTYDMLIKEHPDYREMKAKLDDILASGGKSQGLDTKEIARRAASENIDDVSVRFAQDSVIKAVSADVPKIDSKKLKL